MTWTSAGQRRSATDARGTTWWSYTPEGHLESVVDPMGRSLGYTWDAAGNLGSRTAVVGSAMWTEAFGYDARGQLVTVTSAGPTGLDTYSLSYDETGQLARIEYPSGVTTTYTHDALDRVASITVRDASEAVLASWSYTREGGDDITRIVEADGTTYDYAYDLADRLIEETLTSSSAALVHVIVYSYDDAGNRSAVTYTPSGQSPEVTACSHDARDRISQCGGDDFTWDEDGRLVSREGAEGYVLSWDSEDRLVQVDYASGAVAEHGYDADGHRVWEVFTPNGESPETTEYLVDLVRDLAHDVADVQGGQVAARYVRAGDLLLGLVRGAEAKYFHADHLGSVRALTDDSGDVTDVYRYAPFGELRGHEGEDPQRYRFAGEKHGPEGRLSYNRARWMDPSLGVFGSIDPWVGDVRDGRTLGRYAYAGANPIMLRDPTGREFSLSSTTITVATIGVLATVSAGSFAGYQYHVVKPFVLEMEGRAIDAAGEATENLRRIGHPAFIMAQGQIVPPESHVRDALQHCIASCWTQQRFSAISSWTAGVAREAEDAYESDFRNPNAEVDIANNACGRFVAERAGAFEKSCVDFCVDELPPLGCLTVLGN